MSVDEHGEAEFAERVREKLFPKVKESGIFITLMPEEPDVKVCVELGAAIFYDKPILVVAMPGRPVSPGIRRVAHKVLEDCDVMTEEEQAQLAQAIERLHVELEDEST